MLGDARLAADFADDMLEKGIYVIGFSYPVVPKGTATAAKPCKATRMLASFPGLHCSFCRLQYEKVVRKKSYRVEPGNEAIYQNAVFLIWKTLVVLNPN